MMWGEHLSRRHWEYQKHPNDNNYCYLNTNRHCVKENNSYVHNLPAYDDRLAVNILEVDSKKHDYVTNEFKTENTIIDHMSGMNSTIDVSKPLSSTSPCNNLYVSPPYFTVDKFVNMDQTNHRDNRQIIQPNRNHSNQKEISNISLEYKIPESRESFLINNKNLIGIKVIENSHIPLMHFETSDRPVRLNVPKQYEQQQPVVTEMCNYKNDLVSYGSEAFQKRKKPYSNMDYVPDSSMKNDFVRNQLLSIHQYNGESLIKVDSKNLCRMADLNATIESSQRRIGPNEYQCLDYQRNSLQNGYAKCITPAKNVAREKKKPNYRELINNAHALRSSISENDLNMQIIKRTLNYKQLPTCNVPSRNIAVPSLKRNNDNMCQKIEKTDLYESHVNHLFIQHQDEGSVCKKTNNASPLDLSLKSIKTEAGMEKRNVYDSLVIQKGCPPKYNFEPNFLEKNIYMDNSSNSSRYQSNQNSVIRYNSSRPAIDCKLEKNVFLPASKPEIKAVIADHSVVDKLPGNELVVPRKRTFPDEAFDENKFLIKKKCLKSSFYTYFNGNSRNFDNELEKKADIIKNVQLKTTNDIEMGVQLNQTTIKPEPELESDLKPELETVVGTSGLKYEPEIEIERAPKPEPEPAPKAEPESVPESQSESGQESAPESESEPEAKPEAESEAKTGRKDIETDAELETQVETESFMELKQDVSSAFASRIRTKAELKGFVFQDECPDVQSKNLELNNQLDLCAWTYACDKFVDQLDKCYENNFPKTATPKVLQSSRLKIQSDSENDSLSSSNLSPKRSIKSVRTNKLKLPNSQCPVDLDENCVDEKINENTQLKETVSDSLNAELVEDVCNSVNVEQIGRVPDNKVLTDKVVDSSINLLSTNADADDKCMFVEEDLSENRSKNSDAYSQKQNDSATDSPSTSNQKTSISIATRNFDLTKVSVVRLKREKYASRIFSKSNEVKEQESGVQVDENKTNIDTERNRSSKSTLSIAETEFLFRNTDNTYPFAQSATDKVNRTANSLSLSSIKTRLRTTGLQSKKDGVSKNKKTKHRFENKSESDLPSNSEKIYLEVYRYKRALKVPPNLITIKSKCVENISKSMVDSDLESKTPTNIKTESRTCVELSKDDAPKSIIDVLHSRVVKAKHHHHNKFTQKYVKNERQPVSNNKSKSNFSKLNTDQEVLSENNNVCPQQKRNVFETQVIPSRTRREHKMQLSKETIREVFRGDERPSSAPPQINTLEDIYDRTFNDQCIKYFQKLSQCAAESDLQKTKNCWNGNKESASKLEFSNKTKIIKPAKEDDQCNNNSNKSIRKRKRRIYKKRISSGFDYLRKKKRANKCALRNYSRFKRRKSTTEDSFPFKNESDILKEIQKWVLNKGVGQSALHKAATLGYIDVIVYCLEKMGLHPDHKDNAGYTPLHDACVNGSLDIARVLLQYGANHSESAHSGIRPIHEATENGHIEIVRMLLSYGADPLLETYSGQTPLMLASDSKVNSLISMHLNDVQVTEHNRKPWSFQGAWSANDESENGCNVFNEIDTVDHLEEGTQKKHNFRRDFRYFQNNDWKTDGKELLSICNRNPSIKNIFCDFEFLYDAANAEGELFEFEEADSPLPPLYLLKDEGMEKWVLLSDLCSLLKVKSKDTLLHKIFPSISPSHVSRAFLRELKMCEFLERATCLQLLCAGEKINICHSKVVLIRYNENVRNLLGVKTIIMKL